MTTYCQMGREKASSLLVEVAVGVLRAADELKDYMIEHPAMKDVGTKMLIAWHNGLDCSLPESHRLAIEIITAQQDD